MIRLELSLLSAATHSQEFQALLHRFEGRGMYQVAVSHQTWDAAWAEMVRFSIYGRSPTVSEIGSTWTPDLVGMNALFPLPASMVKTLGSKADYIPVMWESCFVFDRPEMWAIPWLSGARVVYYRKDLLDKANLDPATAFSTPGAMLQTMAQLRESGIAQPWTTSTNSSLNTLHLVCSWIWGAGGDLLSPDGKNLLFSDEKVLRSIADFFALGRYLGPDSKDMSYDQAVERFWSGEAAVTMDGSWMLHQKRSDANPLVIDNLGVALTPGPAFVGGSNLAIWTDTTDKGAAQDLLYFLNEPETVIAFFNLTGLSPAKINILNSPEFTSRSFGEVVNQAKLTGRSYTNHKYSSLVEQKLRLALGAIWENVLNQPDADPFEVVAGILLPLKNRLEVALQEDFH
jgi:multiple sugar transport system substrate-binding protein